MSLRLTWNNEQEELIIDDVLIGKLELILALLGQAEQLAEGEVSLSFVTDEAIRKLNNDYRGLDRPTDVLSFPMLEMGEGEQGIVYGELAESEEALDLDLLGDIVVSIPRALAQSIEYGHSVEREIGFLFVHGFLHLIGYDHESEGDEKEMFAKQEQILEQAGLIR